MYEREMSRERRRARLGVEPRPVRFVDATEARIHLKFLQTKKISMRLISERSGVSLSHLVRIKSKKVTEIRVEARNKILAIPAINPDPYNSVPSDEAKKLVNEMLDMGIKKNEIAEMLGTKPGGHLVIKDAIRIERLEKLRNIHASLKRSSAK